MSISSVFRLDEKDNRELARKFATELGALFLEYPANIVINVINRQLTKLNQSDHELATYLLESLEHQFPERVGQFIIAEI
ncbi:hypothetical protein [Nitrosarchaeum sp. AC2]|uniref:hypothetical protein n=1 Tax=Nitrosarchaeum sp. AC2 TaxID=2259673 RepID=UPI0015CE3312|nr:hypothetical protein [Nitrosarchaeum sp. AC2]